MELICEGCRVTIQIPTERIPQKSPFRVTCPRCRAKIVVGTKASEVSLEAEKQVGFDNTPMIGAVEMNKTDEASRLAPSSSPFAHLAALLCIDQNDSSTEYQRIIEKLGFLTDNPMTPDQALQRLNFNHYSLILLDERFSEKSLNPITDHLTGLSMSIRRDMLVVLVGERLKSGDPLEAFMEGVDLVLHPADVGQLAPMVTRAFNDHHHLYKVFNDYLIKAGKKLR